ncbi:MAG: resolvase [Solivirus sp.]|uniref:Resolvase n=1 Tax=Solivirus sp. TaxID=2487772 RepID=A0A3G5AFD4_9VIRU|nr:MAG: resolvase [Solivirus sp.]
MTTQSTLTVARAYVRVSTESQTLSGHSLETQETRIKDYCTYKKLNLIKVYCDSGISAKEMTKRPALLQLLEDAKKGEVIIVSDLSRLSRSTKDSLTILESLREKGVQLCCLNPDIDFTTSTGMFTFTILAAINKMERERIAYNVSVNLQRLSQEGHLRSSPPFAFRFVAKDKPFEPVPEQQEVILKIIEFFKEDPCISRVVDKLNEEGYNKVLNLNKKTITKERKFTRYLVTTILVDYNVIEPSESMKGRKSIEERIKSRSE